MNTHKEERLKRGMAYCKGCSKDLVDCRCRLDDLQADEVLHEVEPTPPSQIEENTRFVENFESDDNDYDMLTIKQLKILENYHTRQLKVIEGKLEDSVNNTK